MLQPTVRLACLSHAASVRSEPGSNSSILFVERVSAAEATPNVFFELTGLSTKCRETPSSNLRLQTRMFEHADAFASASTPSSGPTGFRPAAAGVDHEPHASLQGCGRSTFSRRSLFTCQRAGRDPARNRPSASPDAIRRAKQLNRPVRAVKPQTSSIFPVTRRATRPDPKVGPGRAAGWRQKNRSQETRLLPHLRVAV